MGNQTDPTFFNCSSHTFPALAGPAQMYESIGHWTTVVYIIVVLHVLPLWIVASAALVRTRSSCPALVRASVVYLICIPPLLISLATTGILLPSIGPYIELLLDIVLIGGMVQFVRLSVALCHGYDAIVQESNNKNILLPIGSPPFVCLLPFKGPKITKRNMYVVVGAIYMLLFVKIGILIVEIILSALKLISLDNRDFFSLLNLHNIVSIPAGVGGIYAYTIFIVVANWLMTQHSHRYIGFIILLYYVLYDCMRLFFIFLTGTGMLSCVLPSLSQAVVAEFLKNVIKGFLAMFLGMPLLKICTEKIEINQLLDLPSSSSSPSEFSSESDENFHDERRQNGTTRGTRL